MTTEAHCVIDGETVTLSPQEAADWHAGLTDLPRLPLPAISDRQFAQGLKARGVITHAEAMAFVRTGEFPQVLMGIIDGLPEDIRDDVELTVAGATTFERTHPFTAQLASAYAWTDDDTDAFWRECAAL